MFLIKGKNASIDSRGKKIKKNKNRVEKELETFYEIDNHQQQIAQTKNDEDVKDKKSTKTNLKKTKDMTESSVETNSNKIVKKTEKTEKNKKSSGLTSGESAETRIDYLNRLSRGEVQGNSSDDDSSDNK